LLVPLTDPADPRLAPYGELRDRSLAREDGRFVAESAYVVERLLDSAVPVESLLVAERCADPWVSRAPEHIPVYVLPEAALQMIVGFPFHRGVLACGQRPATPTLAEILGRLGSDPATLLVCPDLTIPENLGAIARTGAALGVDAMVLKPAATVYKKGVPPLVRTGVSNFFGNLGDAWSFVNSVLQFKFQNAAENFMRLNVNTFFGLGGILDIASELNIERHKEDFGQTLGRWGVPAGPYIVLPLLGPSTLRDAIALPVDRKADPVQQVNPAGDRNLLYVLRAVDARSNLLRIGSLIDEAALDKYSFTRDAYLQRRRAEIVENKDSDGSEPKADGEPAPQPAGGAARRAPADLGAPAPAPAR